MNKFSNFSNIRKITSLVAILIMVSVPVLAAQSASASVNAKFSLSPASKTVTVGSNLVIYLNLDTGGNSVLAWKTTISYSTAAFSTVSVETYSSSHFTLNPGTDTASGGTIKIARYATSASSTNGSMAKITLKSKATGNTSLSFAHICSSTSDSSSCSAVTGAAGTNLLSTITGGSYKIAAVATSSGSSGSSSSTTEKKSIFTKIADAVASVVSPSTSAEDSSSEIITAERGVVRITVVDQNNKPIEGVKVTLAGVSGKTNSKGRITLTGIYPGEAKGTIIYNDKTQSFTLNVATGTIEASPQEFSVTFNASGGLSPVVKAMLVVVGLLMLAGVIDLAFISKGGFKADVTNLLHHGGGEDSADLHKNKNDPKPGSVIKPSKTA